MHALLLCDDPEETAILRFVVQRAGLNVEAAASLEKGMLGRAEQAPDLVVLALRVGSARAQAVRVRRETEASLAVITNSSDEDELYQAYDAGADLVVTRPYSARLLGVQIRALLRSARHVATATLPTVRVGEITLDPSMRMVTVGDNPPRRLTQLEFRLLQTLMIHHGQTVPTEAIVERVWGFEGAGGMELVRGLVRRLRAKVEADARRPQHILTEPGLGYRLEAHGRSEG